VPDWFFWIVVFVVGFTLAALIGGWLGGDEEIFAVGLQMLITLVATAFVALVAIYGGPVLGLFSKVLATFLTGIL
jgi:hypothetical protein